MPQSKFTAHPAMNPPAMTNVACERLTIPPIPVTTTNDRKITAKTIPLAMIPCS